MVKGKENTLHEYAAVDELLNPFIITFWNDVAPDDVYNLLSSTKERHIIAALNFSVSDYHNISPSSTSASVVLIKSNIERVQDLQKWLCIHKERIDVLQQQGDVFRKAQTNFSHDPEFFTSIETLLTTEQPNRYDLLARGKVTRTNQNFIYPCCAKCHRLTSAAYGRSFECHSCHEIRNAIPSSDSPSWYMMIPAKLRLPFFGDEGGKLMQMSANDFLTQYCNNEMVQQQCIANVLELSAPQKNETTSLPSTTKEHPRPDIHPNTSSRGRASKAKKTE
ncbi:hypothetical protein OROHE_010048 [Orobanche hederae]